MSLRKELHKAGASQQEVAELATLAGYVACIKPNTLSLRAQKKILANIGETNVSKHRHRPIFWLVSSATTASIAIFIVMFSLKPPVDNKPMTQKDGDSSTNVSLPVEQIEYIDNLAKEHQAELEQLNEVKAAPEQVEAVEFKYKNAFEEFWSRNYRENDERRSKLWQRMYDRAHNPGTKIK